MYFSRQPLLILGLLILSGCSVGPRRSQGPTTPQLKSFALKVPHRAWQGVAVDDQFLYLLSDRNESFVLENLITVLSHDGREIRTIQADSGSAVPEDHFFSFGDGNVISGKLYVTAYNFNSRPRPKILKSRILVYDLPSLTWLQSFEIGDGVAESVTLHAGFFWVTYHDRMLVRRFDTHFVLLAEYPLSEERGSYGGYQGAVWRDDRFFLQMHGPNHPGKEPSKGLDVYRFVKDTFVFEETLPPLSYGSGQGVAVYGDILIQNDRPGNAIEVRAGILH